MRKVGFIVETDKGDSLAYSVLVHDTAERKAPDMEVWGLGVLKAYDYVSKDSKVIRLEWEFEEEVEV